MIPLLPLAATAILFYPSASPSLLAKSVIAEPSKGTARSVVINGATGNQLCLGTHRAGQLNTTAENIAGVVKVTAWLQ